MAQDDSLLQGTLAENISGFDEQVDMARVRECADLAQIKTDIERMPMGYESLVGDMGATPFRWPEAAGAARAGALSPAPDPDPRRGHFAPRRGD